MAMACRLPVGCSVAFIYPRLFSLHDLTDEVGEPSTDTTTPMLPQAMPGKRAEGREGQTEMGEGRGWEGEGSGKARQGERETTGGERVSDRGKASERSGERDGWVREGKGGEVGSAGASSQGRVRPERSCGWRRGVVKCREGGDRRGGLDKKDTV